jgi:hypothetical protein
MMPYLVIPSSSHNLELDKCYIPYYYLIGFIYIPCGVPSLLKTLRAKVSCGDEDRE